MEDGGMKLIWRRCMPKCIWGIEGGDAGAKGIIHGRYNIFRSIEGDEGSFRVIYRRQVISDISGAKPYHVLYMYMYLFLAHN
jgi:hypothetical protein